MTTPKQDPYVYIGRDGKPRPVRDITVIDAPAQVPAKPKTVLVPVAILRELVCALEESTTFIEGAADVIRSHFGEPQAAEHKRIGARNREVLANFLEQKP